MDRRLALKNLMVASGGMIALPAWAREWSATGLEHASSFTPAEQTLISSVSDTIIPAGNSIGALAVGVDKFLQKMIDDCYEPDISANVKKQLQALELAAKTTYGKSYPACDQLQRETLLLKFSSSTDKSEKDFFTLVKNETIRGFNTSKEVMTKYLKYQVAPGHYYGCVNVKA